MDTPRSVPFIQRTKRARPNPEPSPNQSTQSIDDHQLASAIDSLRKDNTTPAHLKTILEHLVLKFIEKDRELTALKTANDELISENSRLKNEVSSLKSKLSSSNDQSVVTNHDARIPHNCSFEEHERLRSVVVAGVGESRDPNPMARVSYDLDCVKNLLQYLNVDCMPITIYRLGRPMNDRNV